MVSKQEFITKIKTKYPQYKDVEDDVLYEKITTKYPEYKKQITEKPSVKPSELSLITSTIAGKGFPAYAKERAKGVPHKEILKAYPKGAITAAEIASGFAPPISPAVMGTGEFARAKIEGVPTKQALKRGGTAAAIDTALILGTLGLGKAIGAGGKLATRILKKVPKSAMAHATKNPNILLKPQPKVADMGDDIIRVAKELKNQADETFEAGLKALNIKPTTKISTKGIIRQIGKYKINKQQLAATLKTEARRQMRVLPDTAVDNFINGKAITFNEARDINSLLSSTLKDLYKTPTAQLGGGAIGRLSAVKKANMKAIENIGKAGQRIKGLNRQYAVDRGLSEQIVKQTQATGGNIKEGALKTAGETLIGKGAKRMKEVRRILQLQKRTGQPIAEGLKNSVAREAFEKSSEGLMGVSLRGGTGALVGGAMGGVPGAIAGGVAGAALPFAMTPGAIGRTIQLSKQVPRILKPMAIPAKTYGIQKLTGMMR